MLYQKSSPSYFRCKKKTYRYDTYGTIRTVPTQTKSTAVPIVKSLEA